SLELGFRADDERKDSTNRCNYVELIKLLSLYDEALAARLQESSVFLLSTIVRYVTKSGYGCERFLGFTHVSADRSTAALSKHVNETIPQLCCGDKFIAQAYDGASVMSDGELNGTQAKVKE
ncbi:hypothetical protein ILUMI_17482, partial [Ignelater luminosus]